MALDSIEGNRNGFGLPSLYTLFRTAVMVSTMLDSGNCGVSGAARFDYVGLKPLKVHCIGMSCVFWPRSTKEKWAIKMGFGDDEFEASVVAGNIQEAAPVPPKPAAPPGTLVVLPSLACTTRQLASSHC